MNPREVGETLTVVKSLWPHSNIGEDPAKITAAWHGVLAPLPYAEVKAAVESLARSGREHAPPVGVVAATAIRARQGSVPSFDDVQRYIARHVAVLPYSANGTYSEQDTAEAVEVLMARGAHEVVLRFVAAVGLRGALFAPDPALQPLDMGQQADRRDLARAFASQVLADFERDPRPGVALARSRDRVLKSGDTRGPRRLKIGAGLPEGGTDEDEARDRLGVGAVRA